MDWQNLVGGILNQYVTGGTTNKQEAREHYDQISSSVPKDLLGSIIGPALSSLGREQVQERIYNSATEMNQQQRSGLFEMLLNGFNSSGINPLSLLGKLGINPSVAGDPQQASPEDVAKLAAHAQENEPGIFDQAMSFYADHPTLVKVLGTMAVAAIAKQLYNQQGATNQTQIEGNSEINNLEFERLKNKYQSVLKVIEQQRIQLTNLHLENGRLVIRGKALSLDAANKVWNQIKLYPEYSNELQVDIQLQSAAF